MSKINVDLEFNNLDEFEKFMKTIHWILSKYPIEEDLFKIIEKPCTKAFDQMIEQWRPLERERKKRQRLFNRYRSNPDIFLKGRRETELDNDTLKHQSYYHRNGIEVKDVIKEVLNFYGGELTGYEASCVYNIMKYLMRYKFKANPKQDLDKAIVEIEWLKEEVHE